MIFNRELLRKYFIMGSQNCHRDPNAVLEEALAAGITAFQFREKGTGSLSGEKKLQLGRELRERCRAHDVPFFINDDIELAEELEVDGIHVGQDDMPVKEVRTRFSDKIIGLSISTQEELDRSPLELVDYIGVGPIFTTSTKRIQNKRSDWSGFIPSALNFQIYQSWQLEAFRQKMPLLP